MISKNILGNIMIHSKPYEEEYGVMNRKWLIHQLSLKRFKLFIDGFLPCQGES